MKRGRLEAFSDGVIAIIITIMVLEMKVPAGANLVALKPLLPLFASYVLSFVYVGIYWNNHHHLLQSVQVVNGQILLANLHLLFWLSLIPFVSGWMGQTDFAEVPVAVYGGVLLMSAVAWRLLTLALLRGQGEQSALAKAIGSDRKAKLSLALYAVAVPLAVYQRELAIGVYALVAVLWLIPDRRIERVLHEDR